MAKAYMATLNIDKRLTLIESVFFCLGMVAGEVIDSYTVDIAQRNTMLFNSAPKADGKSLYGAKI